MSSAKDYPGLIKVNTPATTGNIQDWKEPDLSVLEHVDALNRPPFSGDPGKNTCIKETHKPDVLTTKKFLTSFPAGVSRWIKQEQTRTAEELTELQKELDIVSCSAPEMPGETCCIATENPFSSDYVAVDEKSDENHVSGDIPAHVIVDAYWQNSDVLTARNIQLPINPDKGVANVFGAVGMLKVDDNGNAFSAYDEQGKRIDFSSFQVPTAKATEHNVRYFGCSLIPDFNVNLAIAAGAAASAAVIKDYAAVSADMRRFYDSIMTVASGAEIIMMQYDYTSDYVEKYLTQPCGGGGYFVEHHDFPHIHAPMDDKAHGHIIIGKPLAVVKQAKSDNDDSHYTLTRFAFTAFEIPHGCALYTPSNTLHGDGTLIGNYGITVANASTPANTVLFYKDKSDTQPNTDLQMITGMVNNTQ